MNLADDYDKEGGNWLGEGWHNVTVKDVGKLFTYNSGANGVEFNLIGDANRVAKVSFCLKDSIVWRLAKFAKACGLPKADAVHYEHHMLIGKRVQVMVVPDGKYSKVDDWAPIGEPTQYVPPPVLAQQAVPAAPAPPDDDIPF